MLELLTDPAVWASFLTLAALEIVLGIDNIIFLSIVTARLPEEQQAFARRLGLSLALVLRILLLLSISWLIGLTRPVFELSGFAVSWRDLVLFAGGLFLLVKGTIEIHHMMEGFDGTQEVRPVGLVGAVLQIALIDIVFSLDSVITAVGMAEHVPVMVAAVVVAIAVMMVAAEPTSRFVNAHPTVKMLALSFLLLVGLALIADALHFHIPRGYLYFAIAFSALVEALNLAAARARARRRARRTLQRSEASPEAPSEPPAAAPGTSPGITERAAPEDPPSGSDGSPPP